MGHLRQVAHAAVPEPQLLTGAPRTVVGQDGRTAAQARQPLLRAAETERASSGREGSGDPTPTPAGGKATAARTPSTLRAPRLRAALLRSGPAAGLAGGGLNSRLPRSQDRALVMWGQREEIGRRTSRGRSEPEELPRSFPHAGASPPSTTDSPSFLSATGGCVSSFLSATPGLDGSGFLRSFWDSLRSCLPAALELVWAAA